MESKKDKRKSIEDADILKRRNAITKKFVSDKQILKIAIDELQLVTFSPLKNTESRKLYNDFYDKLQEFKRELLMDIENL